MAQVVIGLGSNINREYFLCSAVSILREMYPSIRFSEVFKSKAIGFEGPDFFNFVGIYQCQLSALDIINQLHDIEDQLGRKRKVDTTFCSREIDIDLLLYDDLILYDQGLDIPRKEILKFPHVLYPLSLLVPEMTHPVNGLKYGALWEKMAENNVDNLCLVNLKV